MPLLEPWDRSKTRAGHVYDALRADIIALRLSPGGIVQEDALAQQLGVSRTPIREALRRLEQEGLVQTLPKKGTIVSGISISDVREVFQVRLALEPLAAQLAAQSIPQEEIDRLQALHHSRTEPPRGLAVDLRQLHGAVARHCGNRRLRAMLNALNDDIVRILGTVNPETEPNSLQQHLGILDALQARDGATAGSIMHEHILSFQQSLIASLLK